MDVKCAYEAEYARKTGTSFDRPFADFSHVKKTKKLQHRKRAVTFGCNVRDILS
jgi:hypothetical protein